MNEVTTTPELAETVERRLPTADEAAHDPRDVDPAVEPQIGRYRLLRLLGRGGMGVVYTAYDEALDRVVALKTLRGDRSNAAMLARFIREARALARLSHPNIVQIHEVNTLGDGRVFLAMEYVRGRTLREVLAARPPEAGHAEVLELFMQAGRGLEAVHASKLIHRDFKPDNVMVGDDGRVRVMDFGLVRTARGDEPEPGGVTVADSPLDVDLTGLGTIVGTPAYMAPEQSDGAVVDVRADVFSFCASLYEALYRRRPAAVTSTETRRLASLDEIEAPTNSRVPGWLRDVVLRGLRRDRERRWPTMTALLVALAHDPLAARRRALRRVGLTLLIAALAVAAAGAVVALRRHFARERVEALAAEHLEAVLAEARPERAEAAFAIFVDDPAHRDTRALARAWQLRGDRAHAGGDDDAAVRAYAQAYAQARDPTDARAALWALAAVYRATWRSDALAGVLDAIGPDLAQPEENEFVTEAALRRRDLPAALAAIDAAPHARLAGARGVLAALSRAHRIAQPAAEVLAIPSDGPAALAVLHTDGRTLTLYDRALAPLLTHTRDTPLYFATRGPWAMTFTGERVEVLDIRAPDRTVTSFPAKQVAFPVRALDLRADGRPDLFFMFQAPDRGFRVVRDLTGAATVGVAHESSERTGSDLGSVVAADLDGDGTQEIVASFLNWRAYDVRVFHADDDGGLRLVWRRQVGRVPTLEVLRRPDGELAIVAGKDSGHRNTEVFPDPPHGGAAPGVYLLRWTGAALEPIAWTSPPDAGPLEFMVRAAIADLDGDGRDEAILPVRSGEVFHTWIVHQADDGRLESMMLGHIYAPQALELDGDPGRELLGLDFQTQEPWVLGLGDDPLPPSAGAARPAESPPPWLNDDVLRARWTRADVLDRIGLPAVSGAALRDAAALAIDPQVQLGLLDRAADRLAAGGDKDAALALGPRLETDREHGPHALHRRVAILTELGRHAEAAEAALALRDHAYRSPDLARFAEATLAELGPLLDPARAVDLRFTATLSPGWVVERPSTLRRDPVAGALRVEALSTDRTLARLPVRWDGGPVHLEVELELESAEWFTRLWIDLVDETGERWFGVGVGGGGARFELHHYGLCLLGEGRGTTLGNLPIRAAATRRRLVVSATYLRDRDHLECAAASDGEPSVRRGFARPPVPRGERLTLVLTGEGPSTTPHLVTAAIRRITVRGATLAAPATLGAEDVAARALVEGEPGAALQALTSAAPSPRRALLELLAYDDLSDADGIARVQHAALAGLDDDALIQLLRTRPRLAAAVRATLGPRLLPVLARAWVDLEAKHWGDTTLERALLADLRGVEALIPEDAAQRDALAALLCARASLLERVGEDVQARRDLVAALAALGPEREDRDDSPRTRIHRALARLLADREPDVALAHAARAIATASSPELTRDRLASDPRIAPLLARSPAWRALLAPD